MSTTSTATATPETFPSTTTSTWIVDPAHAELAFAVRHLMIATVRGRFGGVTGTVVVDETKPHAAKIDVTVDVGSIDTRQEMRDNHLKSPDFFDAANHPNMHFVSTRIEGDPNAKFRAIGDLTIRGTTKEVVLDVVAEGRGKDPWGNDRAGFSATGKISRESFGLLWNQALEAGGVAVGDEVKLTLDFELIRQKPEAATNA